MLLRDSINNMDRSKLYSNTVAIVQSSGTGKSRMVDELARYVFAIPFNLRDEEETKRKRSSFVLHHLLDILN